MYGIQLRTRAVLLFYNLAPLDHNSLRFAACQHGGVVKFLYLWGLERSIQLCVGSCDCAFVDLTNSSSRNPSDLLDWSYVPREQADFSADGKSEICVRAAQKARTGNFYRRRIK